MRLQIPLTLTACLVLTGCNVSPTWKTVISTRVDTRDSADPSAFYAERMSGVLKSSNVEHKVVTYEFRYRTRLREDAVDTRTAVLYRDENAGGRNPWWLVDNVSRDPVWVPGSNLDRQLEFYLHRPVTVLTVNGVSGSGDGKATAVEGKNLVAKAKVKSKTKPAEQPSFFARLWQTPRATEGSRKVVAKHAKPAPGRLKVAAKTKGKPAKVTTKHLALFRARHGTKFDPSSVADRVKMERLTRSGRGLARL